MPEKNESSQREACGLPKQGNACPYAKLAPDLCARCGWNPDEHARRQALPLTENADGLQHKDISQPEEGCRHSAGEPYFFGRLTRPLRHETAAGGSPRLCTRPAKPQARGPGIKSACGTCARMGTVNVTPRRVSGSPGGIVLPPYGKLSEQTRAARLRRQGDAQAQAVQVRPA